MSGSFLILAGPHVLMESFFIPEFHGPFPQWRRQRVSNFASNGAVGRGQCLPLGTGRGLLSFLSAMGCVHPGGAPVHGGCRPRGRASPAHPHRRCRRGVNGGPPPPIRPKRGPRARIVWKCTPRVRAVGIEACGANPPVPHRDGSVGTAAPCLSSPCGA